MRLVTHLIAVNREIRLRRQLADIERVVLSLPVRAHADLQHLVRREMELTGRDAEHLFGTPLPERHATHGHASDAGLLKARSENPLIATRGVASWAAAVYHETLGSPRPGMAELHRQVLRLMHQIKGLPTGSRLPVTQSRPEPEAFA